MQWEEIVNFLGGASVFGTVIAYLGKTTIDAYVNGRVESYKGELQRLATEHSVRFQRLHSERAEVIKSFYAKFVELDDTLQSTLRSFQLVGEPSLKEKVSILAKQFNDLRTYFLPNRIFLAESVCTIIDEILEVAKGIFYDITTFEVDPGHEEYRYNPEILKERHQFWENARNIHKGKFLEVKAKLEKEFRVILGIES